MAGYKPGDIVLTETPFVHALPHENKGKRCDFCFHESSALKKCSRCNQNFYCNRQCQSKDWSLHKHECEIYKDYYFCLEDAGKRLQIRLCLLLTKYPEKRREMFAHSGNGQLRSYEDLISHKDKAPRGNFEAQASNYSTLGIEVEPDDLFEMSCKASFHSLIFKNEGRTPIGNGLYIHGSDFHHSCRPNITLQLEGSALVARAISNIKPGEKFTINRVDVMRNTSDRRAALLQSHFVICDCSRCVSGEDDDIDYDDFKKQIKRYSDHFSRREFRQALDMSPPIERTIRRVLGEYYRDLSNHMYYDLLSHFALKEVEIGKRKIKKVCESLRITHGPNHSYYKQIMLLASIHAQ